MMSKLTQDELKAVVAKRLVKLRQRAKMTQTELGEKLNYSDKAVSKWERGESMPDVYVLTQLADIYGVSVDSLLGEEEPEKETEKGFVISTPMITAVSVMGIWTLAVMVFVIIWIVLGDIFWMVFIIAIPASLITILAMNSIWNKGRHNTEIIMALVLSIALLVYLALLPRNHWQIFLVLVPAEILTLLCCRIKRPHSTGSRVEKENVES